MKTQGFDEVYQLAADMGGAGYIFTGENDANVMHNSSLINLNIVERCVKQKVGKVFYSSSKINSIAPESIYNGFPNSWVKIINNSTILITKIKCVRE